MFDRLLDDVAVGRHEVGVGERHLLLALDVVGRRAALEVDRAVRHQRNAVADVTGLQVDLEVRHLELGLDRVDDLHADVHRVADDLLLVVVVRERDRRLAMADRDRAGVLDLLQRAGEFLRLRPVSANSAPGQRRQARFGKQLHASLLYGGRGPRRADAEWRRGQARRLHGARRRLVQPPVRQRHRRPCCPRRPPAPAAQDAGGAPPIIARMDRDARPRLSRRRDCAPSRPRARRMPLMERAGRAAADVARGDGGRPRRAGRRARGPRQQRRRRVRRRALAADVVLRRRRRLPRRRRPGCRRTPRAAHSRVRRRGRHDAWPVPPDERPGARSSTACSASASRAR